MTLAGSVRSLSGKLTLKLAGSKSTATVRIPS